MGSGVFSNGFALALSEWQETFPRGNGKTSQNTVGHSENKRRRKHAMKPDVLPTWIEVAIEHSIPAVADLPFNIEQQTRWTLVPNGSAICKQKSNQNWKFYEDRSQIFELHLKIRYDTYLIHSMIIQRYSFNDAGIYSGNTLMKIVVARTSYPSSITKKSVSTTGVHSDHQPQALWIKYRWRLTVSRTTNLASKSREP